MFWLRDNFGDLKKESIFAMLLLPTRRFAKMQYDITTSLVVALSEKGFGLDELVYRMEELAELILKPSKGLRDNLAIPSAQNLV